MTRSRRAPGEGQGSLLDAVLDTTSDEWSRAGWREAVPLTEADLVPETLRAPAPTRTRRTTPLPPPDGVDWAARGAEYREKWAASTAAARARFEEDR